MRLPAVLAGCASNFWEIPDVIGFHRGLSTLVECKTSRSDFAADAKKPFRRHPETGMGYHRWYFAPRGLLDPAELPEKWGLAEWHRGRVYKVKKPEPFLERATQNETHLLVSAVERLQDSWGLQVFVPVPERVIWAFGPGEEVRLLVPSLYDFRLPP